jgi:hypothetical protein
MNPFNDITLINKEDTDIIAEQKRQMNGGIEILLDKVYPEGLTCICGKKVKIIHKHVESSKHRRFVKKHNINIEIKKSPEKPKKPKKPKGPRGRPKKYDYDKDETPEQTRERHRKYMLNYFDNKENKREEQNRRVAEYRAKNRDKCREAVKRCRARKKELERQAHEKLIKGI